MKKIILIGLFYVFVLAATAFADPQVVPYYSLGFTDGLIIPTQGNYLFALDLVNDIGLIYKPNEKNSFIGFYELKYNGPGLKREEGQQFTDRFIDHVVILKHHYSFNDDYMLKSQLDYMQEYQRTGTNEVWGSGLYDFYRYGGNVGLQRNFNEDLNVSATLGYHFLNFPNYTDLMTEFQMGIDNQDTATGKQNQAVYQLTLESNYLANKFTVDLCQVAYQKQKVISDTVQADGSYYSAALQQDNIVTLSAERRMKLLSRINFVPGLSYKLKTSNQNYQQFTDATSTVPVHYEGNYYSYNELSLTFPAMLPLGDKWEFALSPELDWVSYASRPPRDANNNFAEGLQANAYQVVTVGFTYKPNAVTRTTFFYTYQTEVSNMKFEKYVPYNYSGNFFGMNFNYVY
jgi:hypothetical protein